MFLLFGLHTCPLLFCHLLQHRASARLLSYRAVIRLLYGSKQNLSISHANPLVFLLQWFLCGWIVVTNPISLTCFYWAGLPSLGKPCQILSLWTYLPPLPLKPWSVAPPTAHLTSLPSKTSQFKCAFCSQLWTHSYFGLCPTLISSISGLLSQVARDSFPCTSCLTFLLWRHLLCQ